MSHAKDDTTLPVDQAGAMPADPDTAADQPKRDGCVCDCGDCPCNPNAKAKPADHNTEAVSDED